MIKLPPDHTIELSDEYHVVYWRKMFGNFPVCRRPAEKDAVDTAWRLYESCVPKTSKPVKQVKCINDYDD